METLITLFFTGIFTFLVACLLGEAGRIGQVQSFKEVETEIEMYKLYQIFKQL